MTSPNNRREYCKLAALDEHTQDTRTTTWTSTYPDAEIEHVVDETRPQYKPAVDGVLDAVVVLVVIVVQEVNTDTCHCRHQCVQCDQCVHVSFRCLRPAMYSATYVLVLRLVWRHRCSDDVKPARLFVILATETLYVNSQVLQCPCSCILCTYTLQFGITANAAKRSSTPCHADVTIIQARSYS